MLSKLCKESVTGVLTEVTTVIQVRGGVGYRGGCMEWRVLGSLKWSAVSTHYNGMLHYDAPPLPTPTPHHAPCAFPHTPERVRL